jgi:Asp/Glu/hydantoin racemase
MVSNVSKISNGPAPKVKAIGILEASVIQALHSIEPTEKFGIITTGKSWEPMLSKAVLSLLGESNKDRFAGVIGTGIGVLELHDGDARDVETAMAQAAVELVSKGASAICLGCAGMSGLHSNIWNAVNEKDKPEKVKVIDGVTAGVQLLQV